MKMIVGLGNPGEQYANTRHNAGFRLLDYFISKQGISGNFKYEKKFDADMFQLEIEDEKILLVKPMTYMNLSGKAVKSIRDYFKISDEGILVCLDDMDIPLGEVRIRKVGRSGGHNGFQSIIDELGTDQILRIKLGIGRPVHSATQHVLESFYEDELKIFQKVLENGNKRILEFIRFGVLDNTSYSVI